jgi:Uma2 family endonuclease
MATAVQFPVELYLRSSYEPDAEFVDGEIEERPMGEFDHASWQQAIQQWFLLHAKEWGVRVRPELRVKVGATRYWVPDVTVFDRRHPIEQILTRAPIAVFEVLSPEDAMPRVMLKLEEYEQMGIPTIVVVNPSTRTIYQYTAGSLERVPDGLQMLEGSLCFIDWKQVEEFLD